MRQHRSEEEPAAEAGGKLKELSFTSAKKGLLEFIIWIKSVGGPNKVFLIAYNAFAFDAVILMKQMERFNIKKEFLDSCHGFIDPYVAAKESHAGLKSKTMENLLKHYKLLAVYDSQTHNAFHDANDLRRLTLKMYQDFAKDKPNLSWRNYLMKYSRYCHAIDG